jgi:hypothetical protein
MTLLIHPDSHLDHGLRAEHLEYIFTCFGDRHEFFIETIRLPKPLDLVPCALFGPLMGDEPIGHDDVTFRKREGRDWMSRLLVGARPRLKDTLTIIAGPHDDFVGALGQPHHIILYTSYGGPAAPREPGDPTLSPEEHEESKKFWGEHALAELDR